MMEREPFPSAYNAGILGGNDILFFSKFTAEALKFVKANHHRLNGVNVGLFNTIYEQHLFYSMAKEADKEVCCYLSVTNKDIINSSLKGLLAFKQAPIRIKYIHLFGTDVKKDPEICNELAEKLRKYYPTTFHRVMEVINNSPLH